MLNTEIPTLSESQSPANEIVHRHGSARIDIHRLMQQLGPNCIEAVAVDEFLGDCGVGFAQDRAEIEMIYRAGAHLFVQLHLPSAVDASLRDFVDGALHCAAALMGNSSRRLPANLSLPHAAAVVRMDAPCTNRMFAWVRCAQGSPSNRLDVDLCDLEGNVCAQVHGVACEEMLPTQNFLS